MDPTTYTITTSQTSREVLSTYGTYHSRNFAAERYVGKKAGRAISLVNRQKSVLAAMTTP